MSNNLEVIELSDDESVPSSADTSTRIKREEASDTSGDEASQRTCSPVCDELSFIPPVEVCAERCRQFTELTHTNDALAQFYLQDRNWNVERSVASYFEELEQRTKASSASRSRTSTEDEASDAIVEVSSEDEMPQETAEDESDNLLKVISWNIDGLSQENTDLRTNAVCSIVKRAAADIAMLQEVVPQTLRLIESKLSAEYEIIHSGNSDYFTVILLHRKRISFVKHKVFEFSNSVMQRKLQAAQVCFKGCHDLFVLNTHLESTAEFSEERKVQLQRCFRKMKLIPNNYSAIFSGDLNLRDKELAGIGGIPPGIVDVWEQQGSRPEAKFTWDMTRNDNLVINSRFKPKCRFDRMFFKKSTEQPQSLNPQYFGLIGLERLLPHRCFPSDHWGLYAHFMLR